MKSKQYIENLKKREKFTSAEEIEMMGEMESVMWMLRQGIKELEEFNQCLREDYPDLLEDC